MLLDAVIAALLGLRRSGAQDAAQARQPVDDHHASADSRISDPASAAATASYWNLM